MLKHTFVVIVSLFTLTALSLYLLGCGGYEGSASTTENFENQITLAWDAPTTKTDGTPLTDLAGYKVYYGNSSRNYSGSVDVGNSTSASIGTLPSGLLYFSVTAYDTSGTESDYSDEISTQIN